MHLGFCCPSSADTAAAPDATHAGFLKRYELKVFSPTPKSASPSNVYLENGVRFLALWVPTSGAAACVQCRLDR